MTPVVEFPAPMWEIQVESPGHLSPQILQIFGTRTGKWELSVEQSVCLSDLKKKKGKGKLSLAKC